MQILQRTIHNIEKRVYEGGINVALEHALDDPVSKRMYKQLVAALKYQIKKVTDSPNNIDNLLLFTKAKGVEESLVVGISTVLSKSTLDELVDMPEYLYWAGEQGGQAALDKLGIDGVFNLKNPEIIEYFDDYSNLLIDSVDDTTKRWIAARIQEGKDLKLNPSEIAQLLEDEGGTISAVRAERIVITETAKALTTVELAAARRYGIKEKIWRTSQDERVCPTCGPLEGTLIGIDSQFKGQSGGVDGPPAHVTCRCFIEEVIPSDWKLPDNLWLGE